MKNSLILAAAVCCVVLASSPGRAQSTAFTYQGSLDDAGTPANGLHDFRFRLFDAAAGGTQVGSQLCVDNVNVIAGVFTVQLDFGQQFATTAQRHLEIEVRRDTGLTCANATGFVILTPRQQLTAAPIASHANAAFSLDAADGSPANAVFVDNSGNVGIGTTTPAFKLDVRGGAVSVENVGDQADLLWLASERSWVFRQEGTGAGAALKLQSIGGGGNKHFIVQTDGLMGVGTTAPTAKLDVRGNIKFGSSAQYSALGGQEDLRLVRGDIDVDGTILRGAGFTVSRPGQGGYDITFTPPFSGIPSITANAIKWGATVTIAEAFRSASTVRLYMTTNDGSVLDAAVSFCAIGPR